MSSSGGSFRTSRRRFGPNEAGARLWDGRISDRPKVEKPAEDGDGVGKDGQGAGAQKKRLVAQPLLGWIIWCAVCYLFSTTMFCAIENTPGTPCALRLAMFLSISLAAIPSKVTCPFFTIM